MSFHESVGGGTDDDDVVGASGFAGLQVADERQHVGGQRCWVGSHRYNDVVIEGAAAFHGSSSSINNNVIAGVQRPSRHAPVVLSTFLAPPALITPPSNVLRLDLSRETAVAVMPTKSPTTTMGTAVRCMAVGKGGRCTDSYSEEEKVRPVSMLTCTQDGDVRSSRRAGTVETSRGSKNKDKLRSPDVDTSRHEPRGRWSHRELTTRSSAVRSGTGTQNCSEQASAELAGVDVTASIGTSVQPTSPTQSTTPYPPRRLLCDFVAMRGGRWGGGCRRLSHDDDAVWSGTLHTEVAPDITMATPTRHLRRSPMELPLIFAQPAPHAKLTTPLAALAYTSPSTSIERHGAATVGDSTSTVTVPVTATEGHPTMVIARRGFICDNDVRPVGKSVSEELMRHCDTTSNRSISGGMVDIKGANGLKPTDVLMRRVSTVSNDTGARRRMLAALVTNPATAELLFKHVRRGSCSSLATGQNKNRTAVPQSVPTHSDRKQRLTSAKGAAAAGCTIA